KRETGSDDYVARYDGVFGGSWVVEALAGLHQEEDTTTGPGKNQAQYIDQRVSPNALTNGFGFHQDQKFEREAYKADVSKFLGNFELKFGVDQEDTKAENSNWNGGGGQRIYIRNSASLGTYYRHRYYIDDGVPGFDRNDPSTWVIAAPLVSEPNSVSTAAYAQTSWKALPNLTFNLGVRWEKQEVNDRFGATSIKLDDNWAPRVAFIWDPSANGRSKLFGSFGRYYENIPLDINIRAFGGEIQCLCQNFDSNPGAIQPDPALGYSLLGGSTEPVDPDLKGQYIDEILLGYEYEIAPNFAVGIQGTYRDLGRVIEDFLIVESGGYFIANPGEGLGSTGTFYDYSTVPAPKAKREYKGIEVNARKRYSNGWQLYASYLWSQLEGNYDGLFQNSTGQLDPNINSAFDYFDFLVNADGKLTNDRTHTFKVNGSYTVQDGIFQDLTVGLSAYWQSGTPQTAYGYAFFYQNWEYYLTPRGALGRGPSDYEMDLHLDYPIKIGDYELQFLVDVFNLLDRQAVRQYDQRYNLNSDAVCAGIPVGLCNGDPFDRDFGGGLMHGDETLTPIGQLSNPRATATNPDFLRKGTSFTGQRNIRVGLRFRF
ncbi:MAG: TonB-dependent receptor, partial [Acidobacteria bacterium]|nr:TonB-dependent receptor [Acidobacteriota bacterium]